MKNVILSGRLGALKSVKCKGLWPRLDTYYARNDWAGGLRVGEDWILDSPFNNAIGHQLNMICFLAGREPEKSAEIASVQAELYRARPIESADTACIRVKAASGVPLYFYVTHSSETVHDPEIVVQCERGSLRWTFAEVTVTDADGGVETYACEKSEHMRAGLLERLA